MPQRLSLLDASFLAQERPNAPLQLGGLYIFGPGLRLADVAATLHRRLDQVPLARSRVLLTALGAGRPAWVDDPDFDLSFHLRHAALPHPGDMPQLWDYVARLIARPLDRDRPLWELYFIEGLEGGRTALFRKVHLAMADQANGDPFGILLDETAAPPDAEAPPQRWEPSRPPSQLGLRLEATRERLERTRHIGLNVRGVAETLVRHPARVARGVVDAVGDVAGVAARLASSAPPSPLNGPLCAHRRFVTVRLDLHEMREVRRAAGSTLNDVVISITADAVGRLLRWRGHDTKDLDLRVMVPVRVHDAGSVGGGPSVVQTLQEGAVGVVAPLPVMQMDPLARLYRVMGEMARVTGSRQAVAADALMRVAGYGPGSLHATAARVASAEQRYNVALSNAPGPQAARYLAGTRLEETYPFIPLAGDSALSVAVSSYTGGVYVGLLGDRDAMTDLELLGDFFGEALNDLVVAAQSLSR